jgi:hypothetical protein
MLSWIYEFNLNVKGEEAEGYLTTVLREWPALYAEIPGVRGTLLLSNAFALAGEYAYLYRIDVESFATLSTIDRTIKSDDRRWRKVRDDWFARRTAVRARLVREGRDSSTLDYLKPTNDGLVHYVLSHSASTNVPTPKEPSTRTLRTELSKAWEAIDGVHSVQHLTAAMQAVGDKRYEAWTRLRDLDVLGDISAANDRLAPILRNVPVNSQLYGELREVDGALISGA